jgi:hypothetical protein
VAGHARRNPIFASDIRQLGGGDIAFLSMPMMLEDHAAATARVLAEFVNSKEIKLAT